MREAALLGSPLIVAGKSQGPALPCGGGRIWGYPSTLQRVSGVLHCCERQRWGTADAVEVRAGPSPASNHPVAHISQGGVRTQPLQRLGKALPMCTWCEVGIQFHVVHVDSPTI